ncbi:MAG: glycosyltransferase family 39 protein [Candidatus Hydrogenedentes bacterium]|nr:glycosyltransferase family 39 protein [Candidatus Hydrogenedentota bacterium]
MSALIGRWELSTRQRRVLLAVVFVLGAGLRLYHLGERSLWYDEAFLFQTSHVFDLHATFMDPAQNMDPPLMLAAARFWEYPARAAGLDSASKAYDYYLRLFPCLLGILSIGLVARVCRVWTGDPTLSVFAAFLYAISPFQVYYAQEFRSYALTVPLTLGALLALHGALTRGRNRSWLALIALEVLMVYNHFFSVSLLVSINAFFAVYFVLETRLREWSLLLKWSGSQAVAVVLLLPALYMMRVSDKMFMNLKYPFYPPPDWKTALITFKDFFAGYSPHAAVYHTLFVAAAALAFVGAASFAYRRQWRALFLFGILLGLPIVASIIVWHNRAFPMYAHRLYIVSGVMAALFAANGLRSLPSPKAAFPCAALVLILTAPCLADFYGQRMHPMTMHRLAVWDKVQNREAAVYIKDHRRPGDGIGHVTHFTYFPFCHYIDGMRQFLVAVTRFEIDDFVASLGSESLLKNVGLLPSLMVDEESGLKRLWFVETNGVTFDFPQRGDPIRAWLDERYTVLERTRFDGITLTLYDLDLNKREQAFADRLADDGKAPMPVYRVNGNAPAGQEAESVSPTLKQPSPDMATAAASAEPRWEVRLEKAAPCQFQALISSSVPRELDCRIVQAELLIPPLAFHHADYNSYVWRQQARITREDPAACYSNDFSMSARMLSDTPQGAAIYRDVQLEPGAFDVYAMLLSDARPDNTWCANADFRIGDTLIGTIRGNDPSLGGWGWYWRHAGRYQSDGSSVRLTITVQNPGLAEAWFHMGYVAFVAAGEHPEKPAVHVRVDANTALSVPIDVAPVKQGRRVVLLEATDPAQHEVRSILFMPTPDDCPG